MEQTSKTVLIIGIVAILAVIGIFVIYSMTPGTPPVPAITTIPAETSQTSAEADSESITISKDASDEAIDQDMAAIDNQINGLAKDSATVDEGLSAPTAAQE